MAYRIIGRLLRAYVNTYLDVRMPILAFNFRQSEAVVVVNAAGAAAPASATRPAASGQNGQEQGLASTASRQELIALREAHHKKLESLYDERRRIRESCWAEKEKIQEITRRLGDHRDEVVLVGAAAAKVGEGSAIKNYFDRFEWSERLKRQMGSVFGIKGFRLAQEGCVSLSFFFACTGVHGGRK